MADELVKKRITEYGTEVTPDDLDNSDVIFVDSTQHGTRKLRLKGIRDIISGIQNEGIKSSGVSVTADNYAATITNVDNQPVNTIYAYAAGLQSSITNLPSSNALSILHYTFKYSVATNVGQVMIAIERSGENPSMYFRTTSGTPVSWGSWVKMANNADIEAIREELDNLDIETDTTLSISGKPADAKATGDAIDEVKADLDLVTDFVGYVEPINLKGTDWGVGYFNTSTGEFVNGVGLNNNNSKRIVQKAIHYTDKKIICNIASGYRYGIQFWNSYDSYRATSSWQTGKYTIPAGSYYVAGQVAQLTDSVNITDYTQNGLYDAFTMEYADGSGKGSTTTIQEQFEAVIDDINAIRDEIEVSYKTVVCFGNSLTMGATASYSNPWPTQLEALLPDYTIKNHGISGEGVQTIGARQGGIPMLTDGAFTIPSDTTAVAISFTNMLGGTPTPLVQAGTSKATPGVNPCSIAGVDGTLSLSNGTYYFTRSANGEQVTVDRPTQIITDSMKNDRSDILILWTGENGQFDDSYDNLIAYEKLIVGYAKNKNYLIIGRSNVSYTGAWGTAYNRGMMLAHGRKYINIVEYLSKYGLSDLGITPTAEDETAINNGLIPPSLKTDSTHLTTSAYGIVARLVYDRGKELGYWN